MTDRLIRVLVMSDVVDLVLLDKLWCEDPGGLRDDFIYPFAVANALAPLTVVHYGVSLVLASKFIGTDPNQQTGGWERKLGLTEL